MGCFKLKVGDNIYTLTDSGPSSSESDVVTKSDYNIIENYLINGTIGHEYIVEDADGKSVSAEEFFKTLDEHITLSENYSTAVPNSLTATVFINHLIGQSSTDESKYANNIWHNSSWGNNTWYGFTKQRGIIVTGHRNYIQEKLLFNCYEQLKTEVSPELHFYTKIISDLFQGDPDTDIYSQLTWVANNRRHQLFSLLLEIESSSTTVLKGRDLRKNLREVPNKYAGYNVAIGDNFYLITDKSRADLQGDTISLLNIVTGKVESKEITSISKMNDTKTVTIKGSEYYFIGGHWYLHSNKKFVPVDFNTEESLTDYFVGMSPKVITDLRSEYVTARMLLNSLEESDNATIYAHGQYWTKGEGGFYNSLGEKLDEGKQVYSVISDTELEGVKSFLPTCDKIILSSSDIRIIGVKQKVTNFENISFSDINKPVQFSKTGDGVYKLKISYKDIVKSKADFEQTLFNAFAFFKWLNDADNIKYIASLFNFETISKMLAEQFPTDFENRIKQAEDFFKNGINVNKIFTFWNEGKITLPISTITENAIEYAQTILEENKKTIPSRKAEKLFKELLDKGFFIYSCEI